MARESQLDVFMRKARDAERQEKLAGTPEVRRAWEQIAVGYLELAELTRQETRKLRPSPA